MKTELETYLPELNAIQMNWLNVYIALEVAKAERKIIIDYARQAVANA